MESLIPTVRTSSNIQGCNVLQMEFRQHKRDYYVHKLGYAQVNEDTLRDQAEGYVRWETCIHSTLFYLFCVIFLTRHTSPAGYHPELGIKQCCGSGFNVVSGSGYPGGQK
jgi:hypothetical protein